MMRKFFILIPADQPNGPVKGAYALANALADSRQVSLVTLKKGPGAEVPLDPRVEKICLAEISSSMRGRLKHYQGLLRLAGGRNEVASISMCFSADGINVLCRKEAVICSSVRGNLVINYKMDYGLPGVALATTHLASLRFFDYVVAMSEPMAKQIKRFSGVDAPLIGNFIDEDALSKFPKPISKSGPRRLAFVGALSHRKQPWLLLEAVAKLHKKGQEYKIDFIGDGPDKDRLLTDIDRLGMKNHVQLHGFVKQPYELLAKADAMVLPSLSEGAPRAALEAMYLGVPCVLRNVDGNSELIMEGINGTLFSDDQDLADAIEQAAGLRRSKKSSVPTSLLPEYFSQGLGAKKYLQLVEGNK